MKTLLFASFLATAIAFVVLYQIGSPCNSYVSASSTLPWIAFLVSTVPIVLLPTRWVDSSNQRVLATAYFLAIAMPWTLLQLGNSMLLSIGGLGGC